MAEIIGLPKLSPTMEEGVLVKWLKGPGDHIEPGDLVAEVETDKANMDFSLEDEGVLLALLVEEGDVVALGDPVAILGKEGEDVSALIAQAKARAGAAAAATPAPAPAATPALAPAATVTATVTAATPAPAPAAAPISGGRILASPMAKTLAIELGIDLRSVRGTGPGGRIVERDVRALADRGGAPVSQPIHAQHTDTPPVPVAPMPAAPMPTVSTTPAPAPSDTALAVRGPATATPTISAVTRDGAYHDEPLSKMRKRIAERLTAGKRDVPHFYLTRSFDAAPMLGFRKRLNELLGDRGRVSVNDLIIKGVALALRQMPACNAAFIGDAIRYHGEVHIGVAVAVEQGLITPVVRNADLKGIGVIASEVKDLATRAHDRRLKMHEIEGSTFTVSNLGMFGIEHFTAIINPPEAGILAVGAAVDTPVVRDGEVSVGKRMTMTMSCDHRVIDGALGARFLQALVALLEQPESLAL